MWCGDNTTNITRAHDPSYTTYKFLFFVFSSGVFFFTKNGFFSVSAVDFTFAVRCDLHSLRDSRCGMVRTHAIFLCGMERHYMYRKRKHNQNHKKRFNGLRCLILLCYADQHQPNQPTSQLSICCLLQFQTIFHTHVSTCDLNNTTSSQLLL